MSPFYFIKLEIKSCMYIYYLIKIIVIAFYYKAVQQAFISYKRRFSWKD